MLCYDHILESYPHLTEELIQAHLAALEEIGELIAERTVITERDGGSRDREDNRILAAAVDGEADYLVTLNVQDFPQSFRGITIIEPGNFLKPIQEAGDQGTAEK